MLGAVDLLLDPQRPLLRRPRLGQRVQALEHDPEIAQRHRHLGMLGAVDLLLDPQRPLLRRPRLGQRVQALEHDPEIASVRHLACSA